MTATAKFYTGFFVALAIVIAVAFAFGYHVGSDSATRDLYARVLSGHLHIRQGK